MNSAYRSIIYSNNDVLVPDGAISLLQESLSERGGNCDMVWRATIARICLHVCRFYRRPYHLDLHIKSDIP